MAHQSAIARGFNRQAAEMTALSATPLDRYLVAGRAAHNPKPAMIA